MYKNQFEAKLIFLCKKEVIQIIVTIFIRCLKDLKDQIRLLAKQEGISINKMVIKLIELGLILYFKGGMIKDENVNMQVDCK